MRRCLWYDRCSGSLRELKRFRHMLNSKHTFLNTLNLCTSQQVALEVRSRRRLSLNFTCCFADSGGEEICSPQPWTVSFEVRYERVHAAVHSWPLLMLPSVLKIVWHNHVFVTASKECVMNDYGFVNTTGFCQLVTVKISQSDSKRQEAVWVGCGVHPSLPVQAIASNVVW